VGVTEIPYDARDLPAARTGSKTDAEMRYAGTELHLARLREQMYSELARTRRGRMLLWLIRRGWL
jgi:hypothetical protein